jgi:hypothetical protein
MAERTIAVVPAPRRSPRRRPKSVRFESMHPDYINLIVQQRRTYDDDSIRAQANSMAHMGLQQAIAVAELDDEHVGAYLEFFGRIFGADLSISQLHRHPETGYFVIAIFGHRRTLSGRLVYNFGCDDCQEKYGELAVKRCFREHGDDKLDPAGLDAKVFHNIAPENAFARQQLENTYEPPSRDDIAEALREDWEMQRRLQPKLTKLQFARQKGRTIGFVSDSLRFCDLPDLVKRMVKEGHLAFTAAIELTRLATAGLPEDKIIRISQQVLAGRLKVKDIKPLVTNEIKDHAEQTDELFIMDEAEVAKTKVAGILDRQTKETFRAEAILVIQAKKAQEANLLPNADPLDNPEVRQLMDKGTALRNTLLP